MKRVLVLGSGALQIGQAGEFDYSGSQAIKALKEEGITTILINPNIATIQTSAGLADRIYMIAITPANVEHVIEVERPDGILLSFGGQTALDTGLALDREGVLKRYGVAVLGTPLATVRDTEDRGLFIERLAEIGVKTAASRACHDIEQARAAARALGFPVMLRIGYALGGMGSGIVEREADLVPALTRAFASGTSHVLVEECLRGWKELELEIVRDAADNCIAVCAMENLDPTGVHTGESIVVAPTQTLAEAEYQQLRTIALQTVRHLGVVGECNIQYAVDPKHFDYRVIEVNARLSRSSALASKATGYPLAYVAAKIALGKLLVEIRNGVTGCTTAFFEPALDYVVCKLPRWDLEKFRGAESRIGSEMKSVGEVMAIGRTFGEALQKGLRMLDIGVDGLDSRAFVETDLDDALANPTPLRLLAVARALATGHTVARIAELTGIDPWFLHQIAAVVQIEHELRTPAPVTDELLRSAKRLGFSDRRIAALSGAPEQDVRRRRRDLGLVPHLARIDTLAAEFPAQARYLYASYRAAQTELPPAARPRVLILGSGPYRIGSSVEFDWSCVSAAKAASQLGYETVMVNNNPETVSTDHDECDVLVFDEISVETILELFAQLRPIGVVISMGGQLPNRLALALDREGIPILGTRATDIDIAEDRNQFSTLLDKLGVDQPRWAHITRRDEAGELVARLGGFPVLVRPSYVLSGAAMMVAHSGPELESILVRAQKVTPEHPVVISKFESHAREVELDAVAKDGELLVALVSEHIEDAGVHSGDATIAFPPQRLYVPTIRRVREIGARLARALRITGPFNVQYLAKNDSVKVIECNLRASRSLPFVSKATNLDLAAVAMRAMLGAPCEVVDPDLLQLDYVAVKAPKFSFSRIRGADPLLGVEMSSTGEVGCFGRDLGEALLEALVATGFRPPVKGVLLSLGPVVDKYSFYDEARILCDQLALPIYATAGTHDALAQVGISSIRLAKSADEAGPSAMQAIERGLVDLVINVPRSFDTEGRPDGYMIRRAAIDARVPLFTELNIARAVVEALLLARDRPRTLRAWNDVVRYHGPISTKNT